MNKNENAKKLLMALTEVDDKYVSEAQDVTDFTDGKNTATIFSYRNVAKFAAASAACVAILFIGILMIHENKPINPANDSMIHDGSPIMEVDSIDSAMKITGFGLQYPASKGIYNKEKIIVYNKNLIDVRFVNENESGTGFSIRKGAGIEDISGDYTVYGKTIILQVAGKRVTLKGNGDTWSSALWIYGGYSYAIGCQEHPMSEKTICDLIKQIE